MGLGYKTAINIAGPETGWMDGGVGFIQTVYFVRAAHEKITAPACVSSTLAYK